jgi:pyruvate/2-oxoglutarate dehydrogenase complex dihydrolipoamide acyltransferase (E2) component
MTRLLLPTIDANLVDATVTAWHKRPNDAVTTGEPLVEMTTDKAAFDLESPATGLLLRILAGEKSIVPAGYILAVVGQAGEEDAGADAENEALMAAYRAAAKTAARADAAAGRAAAAAPTPPAGAAGPERVRATPRARQLARQHGIDLAAVQAETAAEVVTETVLRPYLPGGAA